MVALIALPRKPAPGDGAHRSNESFEDLLVGQIGKDRKVRRVPRWPSWFRATDDVQISRTWGPRPVLLGILLSLNPGALDAPRNRRLLPFDEGLAVSITLNFHVILSPLARLPD